MQPQGAFECGQKVRVQAAGVPEFATVRFALPGDQWGSWDLILVDDEDRRHEVNLAAGDTETVRPLVSDGQADSARVLAAMWTQWMNAAATNAESSARAATPLNDLWVVSLEFAAVNPAERDAIRPDKAGWDLVVFDEAHRLTPTAAGFHQVGRLLTKNTPRALLTTTTPHRGKEWPFRHLLHLVDPEIYPDPGFDPNIELSALRPGPIHFLRRMKEDLVDYDGTTRLFKGRTAHNHSVPLSQTEYGFYRAALDMVDRFFPPVAQPLARMVYGKRAASSLYALAETLRRRHEHMGAMSEAEAALIADRADHGDEAEAEVDEAKVIHKVSASTRAERVAINSLVQ